MSINTAEFYMQARTKLDQIADSMTSGPTAGSIVLLREMIEIVYNLRVQAALEINASDAREAARVAAYMDLT